MPVRSAEGLVGRVIDAGGSSSRLLLISDRANIVPARLLRVPTVCAPCRLFACPYQLQCLDVAPETVVAAGRELLAA